MGFVPMRCPRRECRAFSQKSLRYRLRGKFFRRCDGRWVQRFLCLECKRTFSTQTFRFDYRLQRPALHLALWKLLISKVTIRQSARLLRCTRKSVELRLVRMGEHCKLFHQRALAELPQSPLPSDSRFLLDELETFENDRRLQPLTVPVLIQSPSYFVVDIACAPLPCRGGLSVVDRARKVDREMVHGKRRGESRAAVESCLDTLAWLIPKDRPVVLHTDCKLDYRKSIKRVLGSRALHLRTSSRHPRGTRNPLFPINLTMAMLRDGVSRLVRRTWANSKRRVRLEQHLWIWVCWRNYMRGATNRGPTCTPAMIMNKARRRLSGAELWKWRVLAEC